MKVGLIGATNVGKSTLFNRIIRNQRSIITDIAGTTRDIVTEPVDLGGVMISVSDSPGLDNFYEELVYIQKLIESCDLLLFVVDFKVGVWPKEQEIMKLVRKFEKEDNTIVVVNKADKWMREEEMEIAKAEYWALGIQTVLMISAKNGANLDELEELLHINATSHSYKKIQAKHELVISFVGRPNVGKSTLLNTFVKEEVSKVSEKPGTTLDYISSQVSYGQTVFKLVDTAGIRRQSKIVGLEKIALSKTLKMLEYQKPITILLRDGTDDFAKQDLHLVGELIKMWLPIIIAINKIDLLNEAQLDRLKKGMPELMRFAPRIPVIFISGKEGKHLDNLMKQVKKIHELRNLKVSTNRLNTEVLTAQTTNPPKFPRNKICKIRYLTQIEADTTTFVCFVNNTEKLNFSLTRWLENVLRRNFGFEWLPIRIDFRGTKEKEERK